MKYIAACVAAVMTLLPLASHAAPAPSGTPYDIDVVLPLTGYGAFNGQAQSETLHVIEDYINSTGGLFGKPLRFVKVDSTSNPQANIQLTNAILAKHPTVVIEGGPATLCRAVSPLYEHGPVMWCLSPAFFPVSGSFAFASGIESRVGMQVTLQYLLTAGYKRIGFITATDVAGQEADAAFKLLLADPHYSRLSAAAWEHFAANDISADAQLAKIKESHPDVVIGWATGTPTGTLLRGFKDSGMTVPFITSSANQTYEQMQQYHGLLPSNYMLYSAMWPRYDTLGPGPLKNGMTPYVRSMAAAGKHIDGSTALVWDGAMVLVTALRRVGPNASPDRVRAEILTLRDYYGPDGAFDFRLGNQRGLGLSDAILVRWNTKTGSWQPVSAPGGTALKASR